MAAVCLLLLVLLPLVSLLVQWLGSAGLAHAGELLGSARLGLLLGKTLALAMATTALALLIGVPLGALLARTDVAGRGLALGLHAFPLFLPPFLVALGWFQLLGRGGIWGTPLSARLLFAPLGVIAVLGLVFSPIVTGLTLLGLRGVDPSLEQAARVVAPPGRVMRRVLLPLAWPAIAFAALLVFALSVSELGVPALLRVQTYPAAVFARLAGQTYAPGEAFALVLPLLAVALVLLGLERRFLGARSFSSLKARGASLTTWPLGRARPWVSAGVWCLVFLGLYPLLALAWRARTASLGALLDWMGATPGQSLRVAALTGTVVATLGVVLGTRLARGRRFSAFLDALGVLAFIMPSAVLGVGLVATFHHRATHFIYATTAMLVVGLVARYFIVGVRTFASSVSQSPVELEQAAALAGAGYLRRMSRIVVPMHARALFATWLLAMVFALRDLDMVVLFYPPGRETLPIRIFTLEANGPVAILCGLACVHVVLTAGILAIGGLVYWRWSRT